MKIFFTNETKKLDRFTIENEPISSIDLMERAASAVTFEIISRWKRNTPIVVFAGPGNNGGDALAVSRMLIEEGYTLNIFLFNPLQKLSQDCLKNRDRLQATDGVRFIKSIKNTNYQTNTNYNLSQNCSVFTEVVSEFIPPILTKGVLVIDGLFGSGLNKPLSGGFGSVVQYINSSDATVVSIDLPSGLFGENNSENIPRNIIQADLTITFQYPKLAFMFAENEQFIGEWEIADIGIHPDAIEQTETKYYYIEPEEAARMVMKRSRFVSKHNVGHALLIAGSKGMMGAAVLAARATLHTGAGLVSVHSAACGETILQTAVPEALFIADNQDSYIAEIPLTRSYSAIAVGPGLGRHVETARAFYRLLEQVKRPLVLDADALNLLNGHNELLEKLPKNSILTPHHFEFDRLFGKNDTSYERLNKAKEMATRYHIIIVLKGANTAIITPKGDVLFNSSGNPGMATAGSGDTLTGIITGLLAQGYHPIPAAILGVFLHGQAGDIAAEKYSQEYITAEDIISQIGEAYKKLNSYRD
ncbi:NAD(P)H-hydrate dehydratase [Coprobacter sp.]